MSLVTQLRDLNSINGDLAADLLEMSSKGAIDLTNWESANVFIDSVIEYAEIRVED